MSIHELLRSGTNVSITVTPTDLREFALAIIEEAKEMARAEKENKPEEYLTPQEVAKICGVTGNTLWRWNRDKYLCNVKLGRKNFYRKSDIEKLREGK